LRAESSRYTAVISYRIQVRVIQAHFTLRVTERASGRVASRDLGGHDLWIARFRFGHLDLMRDAVRIRARRGLRASAYNHGELPPLLFSYVELIDTRASR